MTGTLFSGRRLHMVGIGGAGVSGLALLAHAYGAQVDGCDRADSSYMSAVRDADIDVHIGHDPQHVSAGMELVITSAMSSDHPELARARELGCPVIRRGELVAAITRAHDAIVLAGAHGKTTTSAMVAHILIANEHDPAVLIGADVPQLGGNVRLGSGPLVVEGDESDGTLEGYSAGVAVITNIERDHHTTYSNDEAVVDLFARWVADLPADAVLVAGRDAHIDSVLQRSAGSRTVIRTGDASLRARIRGVLAVPGEHNIDNAECALRAAEARGVSLDDGLAALATYTGVRRRLELVGEARSVRVIDDYAHHPTEVAASLSAMRAIAQGRVVVVFQPHLYSRTEALWQQFAEALSLADEVIITPIYAAREAPVPGIDAQRILGELQRIAPTVPSRMLDWPSVTDHDIGVLASSLDSHDVVIAMGAGDITEIAPRIVAKLHEVPAAARTVDTPEWCEVDVPLARFTTIGTGGAAQWFARPSTTAELQEALQWAHSNDVPFTVIGLGSNTVIVDAGFDGLAIRLVGELAAIDIDEDAGMAVCGGGATMAAVERRCRDAGWGGFEFACAIPGSIGGAVRMNAGAYGREMVDVLQSVTLVDHESVRVLPASELGMRYRHTDIPVGTVVAGATIALERSTRDEVRATVKAMQAQRSASQPRAARSFGSVFRNPARDELPAALQAESPLPGAGALIERAGLKGHTVGGARISPIHANFIENVEGASSADVLQLIDDARTAVAEQFGVTLTAEVHLLDHNGHRPLVGQGVQEHTAP